MQCVRLRRMKWKNFYRTYVNEICAQKPVSTYHYEYDEHQRTDYKGFQQKTISEK